MEAAAALVEEASQQYADADGIVRLHDVSWDDYLTLLRIRGDRSAPRAFWTGRRRLMRFGGFRRRCGVMGTACDLAGDFNF